MNKKFTVGYSTKHSYYGQSPKATPKIHMEGQWLETLGFHIGD